MSTILISVLVLGVMGFSFALLLSFLNKKLKVEENPKVLKVLEILPGLNCGACGFSSCHAFAEAVVKDCQLFSGCLPGGPEVNTKISQILGIVGCIIKTTQIVVCHCGAEAIQKKISTQYQGPQTCKAAHIIGGALDCIYGCLAFGDCLLVCPSGALSLKNQRIYVDTQKCTGCGKCLQACPRKLFELVPRKENQNIYYIACSNVEKAAYVKKVCSQGCIGCSICTKVADSPYYMKENLSCVDYTKAQKSESLQQGKDKCPTKCIFSVGARPA